ncbi:MAG: hypothetical protein VKK42_06965 [Lyngbya sp.]|nr:hypothetical protein [Lyngbya sp.]
MVKFYGMLSTVALTVLLTGESVIGTIPSVRLGLTGESLFLSQNQSQNNPAPTERPRNNPPPFEASGGGRWSDSFFNNQPPESGDGGSRGGPLCPLSPIDYATGIEVWSDRPTFIWRGELARIELYPHNNDELLWSEDLTPGTQQVQYTGVPLKPGQTYDLMLFETVSDRLALPSIEVTFTVMNGEKRQQVTQKLEQLNTELQQQNASEEMIAFVRFNYFAENQLWSDALTEAFSVENPTEELQKLREETIPQKFCN